MVYRGPSRGCKACRIRKVKCDETRPACENCTGRHVACPGYPAQFKPGDKIIDETKSIAQQHIETDALRRRPKRKSKPSLVMGLDEDQSIRSVCFFFNGYCLNDRGIQSTRSTLRFLPEVYARCAPQSAVSEAIKCLTLSFFSLWRMQSADSKPSQYHLQRTFTALQKALNDPIESRSDETLLTVILLQFRDSIIGLRNMGKHDDNHVQGAYAIVKHKTKEADSFNTPLSKDLIQNLRNQTVFDALRLRQRVDVTQQIWDVTEDMPDDPCDDLSWLGIEVADVQADYEEFKQKLRIEKDRSAYRVAEIGKKLDTLRAAAAKADEGLSLWADCQSRDWRPVALAPSDVQETIKEAGYYRNTCHVYPSMGIGSVWHQQRFQRLILLKVMISCSRTRESLTGSAITSSLTDNLLSTMASTHHQQTFQRLLDEICAAVPFHLGNRLDPASIDEFDDTSGVEYPWPPPDKNPWLKPDLNTPMTAAERKRDAVGQGAWHMLGPLGLNLKMLYEPIDLASSGSPNFGSLLREGQVIWILQQCRRTLILSRMIPKDAPQYPPW